MGMLGFPGSDTYKTSLYPSIASLFVSLLFLGSFLMNKQHKRYTQSTPSHSLMLAVLLASPASSAGVHEAEIECTGSQSPMCFPVAMRKRASDTHGAASAKLITAHKAHHCDAHVVCV